MELSLEELDCLLVEEVRNVTTTTLSNVGFPSLTPRKAGALLRNAVQTQINPLTLTKPARMALRTTLYRSTRHDMHPKKSSTLKLDVQKEWLIMGDSNVDRFPPHSIPNLQVDVFPGATFRHAEEILSKTPASLLVKNVILSFGINNRTQKPDETSIKQLQELLVVASRKFPRAVVRVPQINFSSQLPTKEKLMLSHINTYIESCREYIPSIPPVEFITQADNIHWTPTTAQVLFTHWMSHLN